MVWLEFMEGQHPPPNAISWRFPAIDLYSNCPKDLSWLPHRHLQLDMSEIRHIISLVNLLLFLCLKQKTEQTL